KTIENGQAGRPVLLDYTANEKRRLPRLPDGPNFIHFFGGSAAGITITGADCFCDRGISATAPLRSSRIESVRSILVISERSDRVEKVVAVPRAPARPVRPTR